MTVSYLRECVREADENPFIPDQPMSDMDLEYLAQCAFETVFGQREDRDRRLLHIARDDVPRLLREIVRLRYELGQPVQA